MRATEPGPSSPRPRAGALGVLGVALSAGLVGYLALELDLAAVGRALGQARPVPLVVATLLYASLFPLRGLRWTILLRPLAPVSLELATKGFLVGFMANNLLPARLGDVVRALVLARRAGVPGSATFATVMLERIFDGLTVVGVLAVALSSLPLETAPGHAHQLRLLAALMALVFGGALAVSVLLAVAGGTTLRLAARVLAPIPDRPRATLLGLLGRLASGLAVLGDAGRTGAVAGLSVLIWTLEVAVYVALAQALGASVSPIGLAFVMAILTLGLTAPSAPGFVGVFEALVIPSLGLLGVPSAKAAAFALVLHAIHYLPGTLLGLAAAWTMGLRRDDLLRA